MNNGRLGALAIMAIPGPPSRRPVDCDDFVPVMRPLLPQAEQLSPYLQRIDRSGIYTNRGPLVEELESRYAEFLGVSQGLVVAAASATAGLTGALALAGPSNWLVPDFTFPASALAVLSAGLNVELTDVSAMDWELAIPHHRGSSEGGILPVVPFGARVNLARWPDSRVVVMDAAASLGSSRGALAGIPRSWAVVFSLHATKVLPAGEGGLVVFGDHARADKFKQWSNFGLQDDGQCGLRGSNAKMPEVSAAYALASLDAWPLEQAEWNTAQETMTRALTGVSGVSHGNAPITSNPYWIAHFESAAARDAAISSLSSHGVEVRRWWKALHSMPAFAECSRGDVTVSEHLARTTLGLPMFRGLRISDAERVRVALLAAGLG